MKKAVITILGIQGGYVANDKANFTNPDKLAEYYFEKHKQEKTQYFNTLPLLIEKYSNDYKIVPIYTHDSQIFNQEILKKFYPHLSLDFDAEYLIEDEKDFKEVFAQFNNIVKKFDEVIIDVTHGFRHLPLLMLIDLIIINFKDIGKVKNILFAKEIKKHTKNDQGLYEIIDLKEYLDLANISYALSSFTNNYTVSNKIETSNQTYNDFLKELSNFSKHILANSLDELILTTNKKKSISDKLLNTIDKILKDQNDILLNFKPFLDEVKKHIEEIKGYRNLQDYHKMFKLSENMREKGYLLNSITLLNEAIGLYCKEEFKSISSEVKEFIETFEEKVKASKNNKYNKYKLYSLTDQSKNLYKLGSNFKGSFLYIQKSSNKEERLFNEKAEDITIRIKSYLLDLKDKTHYKNRVEIIKKNNLLRNNLAHGNSSERLSNVESDIINALEDFNNFFLSHKHQDTPNKMPQKKPRIVKDLRKK